MSENRIRSLLGLQNDYNIAIDELASVMKQQMDLVVDIKLFEIWFQDEETTEIDEIDENVFETQMLFEQLKSIDGQLVEINLRIESITQNMEAL